jgi:hypothetical protein
MWRIAASDKIDRGHAEFGGPGQLQTIALRKNSSKATSWATPNPRFATDSHSKTAF